MGEELRACPRHKGIEISRQYPRHHFNLLSIEPPRNMPRGSHAASLRLLLFGLSLGHSGGLIGTDGEGRSKGPRTLGGRQHNKPPCACLPFWTLSPSAKSSDGRKAAPGQPEGRSPVGEARGPKGAPRWLSELWHKNCTEITVGQLIGIFQRWKDVFGEPNLPGTLVG